MNYLTILLFIQQVDIEKKLKEAPDSGYAIGIFIGDMLPYIILVGLAYYLYYKARNRQK